MDLLERYLQSVRFWLPRKQQEDIIEELRDGLRSRMEDKESSLGRALNEEEMVALLRQSGHPILVAARYQPQQSLIGPALFPLYWFALRIVGLCYLGPTILVWAGMMIFSPSYRASHSGLALFGTWGSLWAAALTLFGFLTLVFAAVERLQSRFAWGAKWDPRQLPKVEPRKTRVSRVESAFGLVFSVIFAIWWLGLPGYGSAMFGPLASWLSLNPALRAYHLPLLVPTLVLIVQQCVNLARPQWLWLRSGCMALADALTLAIMASAMKFYPYLIAGPAASADLVKGITPINQIVQWSLFAAEIGILVALIVHVVQTVQELRRLRGVTDGRGMIQVSQVL